MTPEKAPGKGAFLLANHLIGIKQGLLDQKHMDAMGPAVWLYMWMINKQTKNGKVLGGKPITHQIVAESFKRISRRTYARYIETLDGEYIETKRTPRGLIITIKKAKKWQSDVPEMAQPSESDVPEMPSDVPLLSHRSVNSGTSNIRDTIINKDKQVIRAVARPAKSEDEETISKLYYQVIKSYKLPTTNHRTIQAKIRDMAKEDEPQKIISYLEFLLNQYRDFRMPKKPTITKSLDIYEKRVQIRERVHSYISEHNEKRKVGYVV